VAKDVLPSTNRTQSAEMAENVVFFVPGGMHWPLSFDLVVQTLPSEEPSRPTSSL